LDLEQRFLVRVNHTDGQFAEPVVPALDVKQPFRKPGKRKDPTMKRRDFFSAATGISAASILAGTATPAKAQGRPAEKRAQVYRCTKCSTIVEILVPGRPSLVHCGQPMELLEEQVADPAEDKHVPVIEKVDGGYKVKVGSTAHPMTKGHYIVWIELIADGKIYREYLDPGDTPEATFHIEAKEVSAREYCNLHGLWKDK